MTHLVNSYTCLFVHLKYNEIWTWLCWHLLLHTSATGHPKQDLALQLQKQLAPHKVYITNYYIDLLGNKMIVHKIFFALFEDRCLFFLLYFPFTTAFPAFPSSFPFSRKEREEENIQKRDSPFFGPSFRNSCPRPFPHLAQDTFKAEGDSARLDTLSGFTVSVKAGHGEEWLNFFVLRKSSFPHLEHT